MPPAYPPKAAPHRGMSLRAKSLLLMGGALLVVMGIYVGGLSIALLGSFGDLQDELTIQRVDRVVTQLEQAATLQQLLVGRRATSDATYDLLIKKEWPVPDTALTELSPIGPDIIWLFDRHKNPAGSIVFKDSLRSLEAAGQMPPIEAFRHSRLLGNEEAVSTIQRIPDGLLLLSSAPVLRSNGSGPTPGWLVFGTVLDARWFDRLAKATGVDAQPPGQTVDPAQLGLTRNIARSPGVLENHRVLTHPRSGGTRQGVMLEFQRGLTPEPVQLNLTIPSLVYSAAIRMRTELIWTSAVCVALLMLCSVLIVEFLFIRRIARMDKNLLQLAETGDAAVRLDASGSDEFSRLATSANRLLEALRRRRAEAEKQETLLSGVLDSASEAIMAFRAHRNDDGHIDDFIMVLANRAAQLIILHPVEEMIGHRLLDIFPGNREAGLFERYVKVVEQRVQDSHEFYYEHDGLQMWFESYISPWEDGFVVTFAEITQRKETEQELQYKLDEIERFNRAMIGREERVLEMKAEVNELRARFGLPAAYRVDSRSDDV